MSSFREIVTTLAYNTHLSARDIVHVADLLAEADVVDLRTHEARVAFVKAQPEVMAFLTSGQKIYAIKALRDATKGEGFIHGNFANSNEARTCMGLKEAKDAVEGV